MSKANMTATMSPFLALQQNANKVALSLAINCNVRFHSPHETLELGVREFAFGLIWKHGKRLGRHGTCNSIQLGILSEATATRSEIETAP
jgi:hypothetical protein